MNNQIISRISELKKEKTELLLVIEREGSMLNDEAMEANQRLSVVEGGISELEALLEDVPPIVSAAHKLPDDVQYTFTGIQLSVILSDMIKDKTSVQIELDVHVDDETQAVYICLSDEDALTEEQEQLLLEAGFNFDEWYEVAKLLLIQLFSIPDGQFVHAIGDSDGKSVYVYCLVPFEHYQKVLAGRSDIVTEDENRKFLVVVDQEFVRDAQIAEIPEAEPSDTDGWVDTQGQLVIGIYDATTESDAIGKAALASHLSGEMLQAYELGSQILTKEQIFYLSAEVGREIASYERDNLEKEHPEDYRFLLQLSDVLAKMESFYDPAGSATVVKQDISVRERILAIAEGRGYVLPRESEQVDRVIAELLDNDYLYEKLDDAILDAFEEVGVREAGQVLAKITYEQAVERFESGKEVYLLYADDTEGLAENLPSIEVHNQNGGEFGYENEVAA